MTDRRDTDASGRRAAIVSLALPLHSKAVVERVRESMPGAVVTLVDFSGHATSSGADEVIGPDKLSLLGRPDVLYLVVSNLPEWLSPVRLLGVLIRCLMLRPRRFRTVLYGWSGPKTLSGSLREILGKAGCLAFRPVYLAAIWFVHLVTKRMFKPKSSGNVLALSIDLIGDMVWASPAISSLKSAGDIRELHLLVPERNEKLARLIPGVDRVITYEAPWLNKIHYPDGGGPGIAARIRNLMTRIALLREGYGMAIDFRGEARHAPFMYMTGAPKRIGYSDRQATCIAPGSLEYLLTEKVDASGVAHMHDKHFMLAEALGAEERVNNGLVPSDLDIAALREMIGPHDGRIVVIQPGASRQDKRWSASGFAEVAGRLSSEGVKVVIAGGPEESELCAGIAAEVPGSLNLCGRTSLSEFVALISVSDLVICNETSAISISSMLGTPVVCLMTGVPEMYGPKGVPHRVLQNRPDCYDPRPEHCMCPYSYRCLQEITPDEVFEAASTLLDETTSP